MVSVSRPGSFIGGLHFKHWHCRSGRALRLPGQKSPRFENLQTLIKAAADRAMTAGSIHRGDKIALCVSRAVGFSFELQREKFAGVK